jgi:predicted heme/steroid binding protein/uncharacterized membrane protein
MNDKYKYFTLRELKEFNGKNGKPAYIAYKGKIYDVSQSRLWANGDHRGHHVAGTDLTLGLINAPHQEEVLGKFPVIGELKEESYGHRLQKTIERLHIHSMVVHFSVALGILIPIFSLIYLIISDIIYERVSFYLLILLLIMTPFSGLSGFFSWKVTYEGRRSRIFNRKIFLTIAVTILIVGCSVWRILVPNLLIDKGLAGYIYLILLICIAGITAILGHYGGRIIFS